MATRRDDGIQHVEQDNIPQLIPKEDGLQCAEQNDVIPKEDKAKDCTPGYFDVMIVGYTGQGKSTTADKLVLALGDDCPDFIPSPTSIKEDEDKKESAAIVVSESPVAEQINSDEDDQSVFSSDEDEVPSKRPQVDVNDVVQWKNGLSTSNLTFWTVTSLNEAKKVPVVEYLKQLALYEDIENPHLNVNNYRKVLGTNPFTTACQLISNDVSRIRVLDVPGFFTMRPSDRPLHKSTLEDATDDCVRSHLAVMREIVRIQYAFKVKFNRILYFLPVRGALEKPSEVLKQELLTLARYFGSSIFECMVIIATAPSRMSETEALQGSLFVEEDEKLTQEQFRIALKEILPDCSKEAFPNPPIVFISLLNECEEVVEKVKAAEVAKSPLELSFDPGVCIKCSSSIREVEGERVLCIPEGGHETTFIPYDESSCHPLFIPKHSELEDIAIVNGVKHMVLRRNPGMNHDHTDEVCHRCKQSPGDSGCMRVGTTYEININGNQVQILVDHTNLVEKHRTLSQKSDDELSGDEQAAVDGGRPSEATENEDPTAKIVVRRRRHRRKKAPAPKIQEEEPRAENMT